jgi:hypothetical protein
MKTGERNDWRKKHGKEAREMIGEKIWRKAAKVLEKEKKKSEDIDGSIKNTAKGKPTKKKEREK